jgi:sterol-4alpha-carboxylate 3-dehydrogenase (decarboxylating)
MSATLRKVLVTGASGFLGSRTAVMMLEKGLAVKGFDIRPQNPPIKGLDFIQGDIRNLDDCKRAAEGVDAIFHCAAIAQLAKEGQEQLFWDINVGGTKNMIEAACFHKVARFVHVSSGSVVFNFKDFLDADENLPYVFHDVYGATKVEAEKAVMEANGKDNGTKDKLMTVAIRPHSIYGPGDRLFFPPVVKSAKQGKLRTILGKGDNLSSYTFVDNCVHGMYLAGLALINSSSPACGQVYNINDGKDRKMWEVILNVAEKVAGVPREKLARFKMPVGIVYYIGWLNEIYCSIAGGNPTFTRFSITVATTNHTYSIKKAERDLKYKPLVPHDEGMERAIEWGKSQGDKLWQALEPPKSRTKGLALWLFFVSLLTLTGALQVFMGPQPVQTLFSNKPTEVTALTSRLFACWSLLASAVGLNTAIDVNNRAMYRLTLVTFYVALGLYGFETCVTKTMPFFPSLLPATILAGVCISILWMTFGHSTDKN